MESKFGFLKMTVLEFQQWISEQRIARTILSIQQHHTWSPNYSHFNGRNHFDRQVAMKNHHVGVNGWQDIGQHFTTFPDGTIVTGRSMEKTPACIFGANSNSVCIEHLGNFDKGEDDMTTEQQVTAIKLTAILCDKFRIPVNPFGIIYHHWFDLGSGERNNGTGRNKSCPGTNFFGGNRVEDCIANFLPLVSQELGRNTPVSPVLSALQKYVVVTASWLNVRVDAKGSASLASDRDAARLGAVLRIYGESNGWLKISNSQSHWVYSRYTQEVQRATVSANVLRVRSGPGTNFNVVGTLPKSEEVFISDEKNGWCKLTMEEKWLSKEYLNF